jgi:hypothetical protein
MTRKDQILDEVRRLPAQDRTTPQVGAGRASLAVAD